MPQKIPYLNIFLSSPGDVAEERSIARKIMRRLPNRPMFRGRVALNIIAWDEIESSTAMEASLTPQAAINKGLPTPAESDIVIVIFWSRMGTPFRDEDGTLYESGTHWELLNALGSDTTKTYIYRRNVAPSVTLDDPKYEEKIDQYTRLVNFFESDFFYEDGQIIKSMTQYQQPADFEELLDQHFEQMVTELLERIDTDVASRVPITGQQQIQQAEHIQWKPERSPFPGLRAFTEADEDIFFGRSRETDALVQHLISNRFVAVIGASGSGKSSLVGAGLIPRLRANAISNEATGSRHWIICAFTPGSTKNPFEAIAEQLILSVPNLRVKDPLDYPKRLESLTSSLEDNPKFLAQMISYALQDEVQWTEVFLFIDQFEELFTGAGEKHANAFSEMLAAASESDKIRVVVTMRADFYQQAVRFKDLAELLRTGGSFPLAIPRRDALREMIEIPAERASIKLQSGLVKQILDDTGDEPGNLALMAYALDELYKLSKLSGNNQITIQQYQQLEGVQGAIGNRAEAIFSSLNLSEEVIHQVFQALIEVDERGTATRRRATLDLERVDIPIRNLIQAFIDGRLLTSNQDTETGKAIVEVAHEAILRSWPRLHEWIEDTQDDLRLLRQVRNAALDWHQSGRPEILLWPQERLDLVQEMVDRLGIDLDPIVRDFTESETSRLLREINLAETSHARRSDIGDRLSSLNDTRLGVGLDRNGIPQIEWIDVPAGQVTVQNEVFIIDDMQIAKYPITCQQFQTFIADENGYHSEQWWQHFPDKYRQLDINLPLYNFPNYPIHNVSWYQAVAFCFWLSTKFDLDPSLDLRLPFEWEWQYAAQLGDNTLSYAWGNTWSSEFANTADSGLGRPISVGMYPEGENRLGISDLCGNVNEWCWNNQHRLEDRSFSGQTRRALRGGSFRDDANYANITKRYNHDYPYNWGDNIGFRVVIAPKIEGE